MYFILSTNKERHGVLRHGDSKKHDFFLQKTLTDDNKQSSTIDSPVWINEIVLIS